MSENNIEQDVLETEKDRFIFDLISDRFGREFQRANLLDDKASKIITFIGIFIGLIGALSPVMLGQNQNNCSINCLSISILLIIGLFLLFCSMICSVIAFSVKTMRDVPHTRTLITDYAMKSETTINDVIQIVGTEISNTIEHNKIIIDQKAQLIQYSLIFFSIGMGLILFFISIILMK